MFKMKIFGKKKKTEKSISENTVRIEVFRLLGGSVPYSIAKFEAIQVKDADNNLTLVNHSQAFKDDVDIVKHKLMVDLWDRLEFHKKDPEERLSYVEKKIKDQQQLISSIKDGFISKTVEVDGKETIKKVKVNKIDEDCKLREYKALLEVLKNDGEGSYESVDTDGLKKIYYLYKEGIFIPYKFIKSKTTLYPDISTKRKLYKENQNLIDQDFFNDNKGFFSGWKRYVGIAIMVIWLIANIYWSVNLNSGYANFDERKSEEYSTKCAYWCVNIANETKTFINTYSQMVSEKEKSNTNGAVSIG